MKIDEAKQLCDGEPPEIAEKLLKLYPKDIGEYTREDFLEGTDPYDYLLLYKEDPFTLERKRQKLDAQARKCGVKNFPKLFKEYCTIHCVDVDNCNVTNFPDQPISLRSGNYVCDQRGVKLDMELICPHPIMPVARLVNIDTGVEKIKIAYSRGKSWRTGIFDKKTISIANKITDLAAVSVSVTSESAKGLVKYFAKMEELNSDLIPEIECVTRMGWITDDEEHSFIPYVDDVVFDGEADYKKHYEAVRQRGDLEKWTDFIDEHIRHGSVIARAVFAASLASVLIKPLHCNPFFIHLWGESETAKTVLAMCAASIWARPELGEYIKTFDATVVGKEKTAAFLNSLPFMLDELQIVGSYRDFEQMIYTLTEGVGRMRGNKSGGLDMVPTWKNCIITTGEKPILNPNSNGGAMNRVIEVECKQPFFTKIDPREAIKFLSKNHGIFGRTFIAHLRKNGFDTAEKYYSEYHRDLIEKHGITQKQSQSAALILTADRLASDLVFDAGSELTAAEIADFLKTKSSMSMNPRAYEYVCEVVSANQVKFSGNAELGEIWGVLSCSEESRDGAPDQVYIMRNRFNQICDEGGYNAASLLSWLNDRNMIRRTDKKHYDVVKKIGSTAVRCVCMRLTQTAPEECFEDIDL